VDRYYYLASTLLTPVFGQKPPVSFEDFKETCSRLAAAEDGAKLETLSLVPPVRQAGASATTFEFQERFWKRETVLRNEIAKQRAERLSRKDEGQVRETEDWDNEAQASARRALSAEDPLQAELSLEKDRWDWIEAQSAGHRFDSEALAAYGLKILILERLSRFSEEAGMERYESMYRTILSGSDKLAAFDGQS
jgi:hypothetical protein